MANADNPNGFVADSTNTGGHMYYLEAAESGGSIANGDAVILDADATSMTSDGFRYAKIALATSGQLLGVATSDAAVDAVNDVAFFVADDPNAIFKGQCSGDPTTSGKMVACDIIGATGVMEVNANAEALKVISILGLVDTPDNVAGEYAIVRFRIIRHQLGNAPIDA